MNQLLPMLMQQMTTGQLQGHPLMGQFQQMMAGKSPQEQFQTLLNCAKSRGLDINAKMFTDSDLRTIGLR